MTQDTNFRYRNVEIVVDTLPSAEFDAKALNLPEADLEAAALSLKSLPHSSMDRVYGEERVREIDGLDYVFDVSRDGVKIVVTIARILRPDEEGWTDRIMTAVEFLATLRGASDV